MNQNQVKEQRNLSGCLAQIFIAGAAIGILAAIAIPDFVKFQARAKCSESKTNLGALYTLQTKYYGEYDTYAGGPDCFELLDWKGEGDTMYTYYCGDDVFAPIKQGTTISACVNATPGTSKEGFTVCAAGNIDRDPTIDIWTMRDSKFLKNDHNDVGL